MIRARLGKRYGDFQLEVEFEVEPGVTVLYGASGAGKTLTLDCLAGFATPEDGRILLDDRILFDAAAPVNLRPQQRHCGYVFQDHALFPHMTVRGNLAFAAEAQPRLGRHRQVGEMLERFHLREFADRLPQQLSGGQKQRCSIARALISGPRMLLLDEPARGLDAILRNELHALVGQIRADYRLPILLVTHDLAECFAVGDTVLVMNQGKIVQRGKPGVIYDRPATVEVARLLGIANIFEAEILALDPGRNTSRVRMLGQEFGGMYLPGRLLGDRIRLSIPSTGLRLSRSGGQNRIPAKLASVTKLPDTVRLRFEPQVTVELPRREYAAFEQEPEPGAELFIDFPPAALRAVG